MEQTTLTTETRTGGKGKGFASLTPERRREIASIGGKKAQRSGTAHRFTSLEAQIAGKKGGGRPRKRREEDGVPE